MKYRDKNSSLQKTALPESGDATGRFVRSTRYAVLASAAVHGVILILLSLIVFSSLTDTNPVLTMLLDREDGEALHSKFEELPEIEVARPAVATTSTSVPEPNRIAEKPLSLPDSFFPSAAAQSAGTPKGDDGTAESPDVSVIQNRVVKAGGKKGEVQFALAWTNLNDLDLHVIAPSGERISFDHKRSQCSGVLDVDMNVQPESDTPVENVRWLGRQAAAGRYTVLINLFQVHDRRGSRRTEYQLLAGLGTKSTIEKGAAGFGSSVRVHRFQYVPDNVRGNRRELMFERFAKMQKIDEERAAPLLERARLEKGDRREQKLREITVKYPHTDAAVEALKMMSGKGTKS